MTSMQKIPMDDDTFRFMSLDFTHPKFGPRASKLYEMLVDGYESGRTETRFEVFETLRLATRQNHLVKKGVSKAGPWQSAHQFGLAADFVPLVDGHGWSWDPSHDYNFLRLCAEKCGLSVPIKWDLCHVEHPEFRKLRF